MPSSKTLSAVLLLALAGGAAAQPKLDTNEVVFQSGNWSVVRSMRVRAGSTPLCTGFYRDKRDIQIADGQIIVKVPGRLETVVVRHNDDLSKPPRAATEAEQQVNAFLLTGETFDRALKGGKLALEVSTSKGRKGILLQMKGAREAVDIIRAGCPAPAPATVAAAPACTDLLRARMREEGVSARQVDRICR